MFDGSEKEYLIKNIVVTAKKLDADVEVYVAQKQRVAKSGDWLVRYKDGKVLLETEESFKKHYFPLRGEKGDE